MIMSQNIIDVLNGSTQNGTVHKPQNACRNQKSVVPLQRI